MLSLDQIQQRMCAAIRGQRDSDLLALIESDDIKPEVRLGIYRHHAIVTLTEALSATFPVVCRLVDKRFFSYAAHEYIGQTLPSQPCLAEYGETFPDFLASFPACRELIYLPDVARLEWAINLALRAADAHPLVRSNLDSAHLVLALHPSLQLIGSPWPIHHVWYANQADGDPDMVIDLQSGAAKLQVYRRGDRVIIRGIEEGAYAFLGALASGASLTEAGEKGKCVDPTLNPQAELDLLFGEGLIVQPGD